MNINNYILVLVHLLFVLFSNNLTSQVEILIELDSLHLELNKMKADAKIQQRKIFEAKQYIKDLEKLLDENTKKSNNEISKIYSELDDKIQESIESKLFFSKQLDSLLQFKLTLISLTSKVGFLEKENDSLKQRITIITKDADNVRNKFDEGLSLTNDFANNAKRIKAQLKSRFFSIYDPYVLSLEGNFGMLKNNNYSILIETRLAMSFGLLGQFKVGVGFGPLSPQSGLNLTPLNTSIRYSLIFNRKKFRKTFRPYVQIINGYSFLTRNNVTINSNILTGGGLRNGVSLGISHLVSFQETSINYSIGWERQYFKTKVDNHELLNTYYDALIIRVGMVVLLGRL